MYPANQAIKEYWQALKAATLATYVELAPTEILSLPYRAYVLPTAKLFGLTTDRRMTRSGLEIEAKYGDIAKFPFIVLSGESNFDALAAEPKFGAETIGGTPITLPVERKIDNSEYRLVIDATRLRDTDVPTLRIKLTADRRFVPEKIGNQ